MVSKIRKTGAEPVFFFPPTRQNVGMQRSIRDALAERFPDVAIVGYIYEESYSPIYDKREFWVDAYHLGLNGSRYFSEVLSKDWANLVSSQEPEP